MNLTCNLFLFYNCKKLIYHCHVPGVVPLRYTPTSSISKIMVEFFGIDVPLYVKNPNRNGWFVLPETKS